MTHVEIVAVSTANPPHKFSQTDALAMAQRICCVDERQKRLATALYTYSGVEHRYTAVPSTEADRWQQTRGIDLNAGVSFGPTTEERMAHFEQHALPLARVASSAALAKSGFAANTITHVVTASCTGFTAPGVDVGLIRDLDLRPTTERVHVGYMGCHAAINALRVAQGISQVSARSRVLLCAVELCSLHYCFHWSNDRMLGNALFGDGAGAVVLAASPEDSSKRAIDRWRIAATGSCLFPGTTDLMTWRVGNHGFSMTISPRLPELIQQHLGPWMSAWLAESGMTVADVRSWAIHPGGPRILEAAQSALSLTGDDTLASREVLRQYGNMSSATVLFILESLLNQRAPRPCVMLAFGPGLVAEAALFV